MESRSVSHKKIVPINILWLGAEAAGKKTAIDLCCGMSIERNFVPALHHAAYSDKIAITHKVETSDSHLTCFHWQLTPEKLQAEQNHPARHEAWDQIFLCIDPSARYVDNDEDHDAFDEIAEGISYLTNAIILLVKSCDEHVKNNHPCLLVFSKIDLLDPLKLKKISNAVAAANDFFKQNNKPIIRYISMSAKTWEGKDDVENIIDSIEFKKTEEDKQHWKMIVEIKRKIEFFQHQRKQSYGLTSLAGWSQPAGVQAVIDIISQVNDIFVLSKSVFEKIASKIKQVIGDKTEETPGIAGRDKATSALYQDVVDLVDPNHQLSPEVNVNWEKLDLIEDYIRRYIAKEYAQPIKGGVWLTLFPRMDAVLDYPASIVEIKEMIAVEKRKLKKELTDERFAVVAKNIRFQIANKREVTADVIGGSSQLLGARGDQTAELYSDIMNVIFPEPSLGLSSALM
jgi:hypothetical protein